MIVERPVGAPDQEHGDREGKVADSVDEESFFAGGRCFGLLIPKADEQIAADADGFPENE